MDLPDSKVHDMANDAEHLHSQGKQDTLGKDSSNSHENFSEKNVVLEKQGHLSEQEGKNCEADSLPEKLNCPNYDHVSASGFIKGEDVKNLKPQSSDVFTSRNFEVKVGHCEKKDFTEGTYGATSCRNGSSTVQNKFACNGSPKEEVSVVSREGTDFARHISLKGNIGSENGPPINSEINDMDAKGPRENWSDAVKDGFKPIVHSAFQNTQHKTESSSSNSAHVISHPVSSSKLETKSSKNSNSGLHGSVCLDFKSSVESPAVGSVPFNLADQNSVKETDVPKSSLSNEELSDEQDDALRVAWKVAREIEHTVGTYSETSGSSSSTEERNGEAAHLSSVDSADPSKSNYTSETRQGSNICNDKDNRDSFCSYEVVDPNRPMNDKNVLDVKASSQERSTTTTSEAIDACQEQKSCSTMKPEDMAVTDQDSPQSRFDLNEDLQTSDIESPRQLIDKNVYHANMVNVSMPVPVIAKSGYPVCLPMVPLKFDGKLGWKGSSATSAFRCPASLKSSSRNTSTISDNNCSSKQSRGFTGFDLNVAAVENDPGMELVRKNIAVPSVSTFDKSSAEASSKRADRLDIDLNCLGATDCEDTHPSLSVSSSRHSVAEFDLNDQPSLGSMCQDVHLQGQDSQPLRKKVLHNGPISFLGNSRELETSCKRPAHWGDSSSMQSFGHGNVQPFTVAASNVLQPTEQVHKVVCLQPNLAYAPHVQPVQAYAYNNAFCIGPADSLYSMHPAGVLPYMADPHRTSVISQMLGPGTVPTFAGATHLREVAYGQNMCDTTNLRPNFGVNSGGISSDNGSRGHGTRQFLLPMKSSVMEGDMKSFQPVALSSTPLKRREPDGGWDSYQLGYKKMTSWN